jgi:anaphase-promoting complex subunit 6
MGMEYLRTNNLKTATISLNKAKEINPTDPLIYSELGVINYKLKNYKEAKKNHL